MWIEFQVVKLFNGQSDPKTNIEQCARQWQVAEIPSRFWVQVFPYSLGLIPKSWYIHEETRRNTNNWKTLVDQFCKELSFTSKYPELKILLQIIKKLIFTNVCKWKSYPVVCANRIQVLQSNLHLDMKNTPIE
jgi:hypothetical protein